MLIRQALKRSGVLYESRCAIEGEVAFIATQKITPSMIARLESLVAQMEYESQSPIDFVLPNREFHLTLYEVSGWKSACRIINQLIDQTLIFRSFWSAWEARYRSLFREDHRRILKALKAHAAVDTKRFVVENISRGYEQILSCRNQQTREHGNRQKKPGKLFPVDKRP